MFIEVIRKAAVVGIVVLEAGRVAFGRNSSGRGDEMGVIEGSGWVGGDTTHDCSRAWRRGDGVGVRGDNGDLSIGGDEIGEDGFVEGKHLVREYWMCILEDGCWGYS